MEVLIGLGLLAILYARKARRSYGQMITDTSEVQGEGGMQTEVTQYKDPQPKYERNLFDMVEAGMVYGIEKPTNLNMTNLNEAFKPWSAPDQTPTKSIYEFLSNQATSQAYLEAHATPFYFNKDGQIPLATNQQSNPNVEIPNTNSIRGDREATLANYPRVYVDGGEEIRKPTAEFGDHFLGGLQPTEMEMLRVQDEGRLNRDHNPWGPGGQFQRVFSRNHEDESRRRGVDRATILSPVVGSDYRY